MSLWRNAPETQREKKENETISLSLLISRIELQTTMCASNNTFCTSFFVQAIAKLN